MKTTDGTLCFLYKQLAFELSLRLLIFPKNRAENCLAVAYFFQQDVLKIAYKLSDIQQPLTFRPSCFIDKK